LFKTNAEKSNVVAVNSSYEARGRQIIPKDYFINKELEYLKGGDSSRSYSTSVTKTKVASYDLKWIEDMVYDLWCPGVVKYDQYAFYGISHWGRKCHIFYCYASNLTSSKDVYSQRRIIAVTRLKIKRKYDYGYLEEIKVRQDDQQIYMFKEGDFSRLRLQDIEDMLLLLTQRRLTNLTVDERYDLNVAVHMYTRCIVIQRWVEDHQDRTAYTSPSDPHGIIHLDQSKRKRLMQTGDLYKFSDGTLNNVRTALQDIDTLWGRPSAAKKDHMIYHMLFSSFGSILNQRDLPRDIPLDSVEVLRYDKRSKSEIKGKVPTEMELVLEQTQHGTSHEVSNQRDLPRDIPLDSVEVLRNTKLLSGIEDSRHGPSDAMHSPFLTTQDDFSIFGDTFDKCLNNLDKMLQQYKDTHLVLNWEKCHFMVKEGVVLGHKVSSTGLDVDKAKINVISKLSHHTNIKGVGSFLGHAGFY
nr:reverse transcriptase domain-containing protein [Tanacetum cinerariifolium]